MRLANELAALAMADVRAKARPGMKESEIGALFEGFVHTHAPARVEQVVGDEDDGGGGQPEPLPQHVELRGAEDVPAGVENCGDGFGHERGR